MKSKILSFLLSMGILTSKAQQTVQTSTTMADGMRSNGKIYVVVAVLLTILLGLIAYVIRIDKKVSRLEKDSKQE
jgi:hypothetical protein